MCCSSNNQYLKYYCSQLMVQGIKVGSHHSMEMDESVKKKTHFSWFPMLFLIRGDIYIYIYIGLQDIERPGIEKLSHFLTVTYKLQYIQGAQ